MNINLDFETNFELVKHRKVKKKIYTVEKGKDGYVVVVYQIVSDVGPILTDEKIATEIFNSLTRDWGGKIASGWLVDIPSFYFDLIGGNFKAFPIVKNYKGVHDLTMLEIIGNRFENPELMEGKWVFQEEPWEVAGE